MRIERDEWYVAIHPDGIELPGRVVIGWREVAELEAHDMVSDLAKHRLFEQLIFAE
jgi:hypothetical protein